MDKLDCLLSSLIAFFISFAFTYEAKADVCIIEDQNPVQLGEPWYIWASNTTNNNSSSWEPQVGPQPIILFPEDEHKYEELCLKQEQSNFIEEEVKPDKNSDANIVSETNTNLK